MESYLEQIIPLIIDFCKVNDDELKEYRWANHATLICVWSLYDPFLQMLQDYHLIREVVA